MKAIVFTQYGSPDVLRLEDVEKPAPVDGQVLVKVHAAAANPLDWHIMRADPFLARLSQGLWRPKINRLGADLAGVVEAVGAGVTEFKPGEAVFGSIGAGGFAEYACAAEKYFVHKPANVSFAAAAATQIVGLTAIQGIRDYGHIQPGQKVLVNGASGGIGTFAVQYAKALGTEVTGVSSTRNLELVRSIGADHVVDYTQTDFSQTGQHYDLVFDTIGNISMSAARRALKATRALRGGRVHHPAASRCAESIGQPESGESRKESRHDGDCRSQKAGSITHPGIAGNRQTRPGD